jgi:putative CocE/NonD family hydrolase
MRDGVRIAADVYLPEAAAGARPLPTIVHQTRYHRGVALRRPFARWPAVESSLDHGADTRRRFLASGYAWVDVCARGSGASYGFRPCPWSPDEIADGAEVVDWIVAQPWSDGVVGTTGVSYNGTAAEFLATNRHPAIRAVAPRFSLFDVYPDVAFPGGIHQAWFTEQWGRFNAALDENAFDRAFAQMMQLQARSLAQRRRWRESWLVDRLLAAADSDVAAAVLAALIRLLATGVPRVDEDGDGALLAAALAAHGDNFDVHQSALGVTYRDDLQLSPHFPDETIDFFSPHAYADRLQASGTAVYSYSGWLDGGYQHAAIKRFCTLSGAGHRLLLGPWHHGGNCQISPYTPSSTAAFDHDGELLRFFDHHLRGLDTGVSSDPPVRYFTIGEERWKSAERWPPPGWRHRSWFLDDGRTLSPAAPSEASVDEYRVDPDVGTGPRSRWESLLGLAWPASYPDRVEQGRRLLVYRSAPLGEPLEVTGHPVVALQLSSTATDAHLFVYLEDERPDGRVDYVTEGQLRALHRRCSTRQPPGELPVPHRTFERADAAPLVPGQPAELRFDLLPISWLFQRGHRLRIAIAGADRDHFARLPDTPTLGVHRGGPRASRIDLPVMGR